MTHVYSFLLMLILNFSSHTEGTKHLEISAGQVFVLECYPHTEAEDVVNWTRGERQTLDEDSLPADMKLKDQLLWFFPAQASHSGNYSCTLRGKTGEIYYPENFSITVSNSTCPPSTDDWPLRTNTNDLISCDSGHISKLLPLDPHHHVTWMKDCSPLNWHQNTINLRFNRVKKSDRGKYTCLVKFTYEGNVYTASQTIQALPYDIAPTPQKPQVVQPQPRETHEVTVGSRHVLNCSVFVGTALEPTRPQWLLHNQTIRNHPHLITNNSCTSDQQNGGAIHCHCQLTILQVEPEFLNTPFICWVKNSIGEDRGSVILIPVSQTELDYGVPLLVVCTVLGLFLLVFYFFKIDLVLAYRKHSPCIKRQSDGKLYDAYVSYLHEKDQSNSSAASFALHTLPKVLEDHLGYKLFISGRDALPGAAVHEVIADTVAKSRRLIIILTSEAFSKPANDTSVGLQEETSPKTFHPEGCESAGESLLKWGAYECWVGVYDALVKGGLQVILVQVGEQVEEAQLPESLRYIRHTQGSLHWKPHYTTKPSGRFWKQLHYRMPIMQKTKLRALV